MRIILQVPKNNHSFNPRVYGIYLRENNLLISEETFRGKFMIKFPGGGLQYGEGLVDALKREFREEAQTEIKVGEHFYTTDFFVSSFFDGSQVLAVYYKINIPDPSPLFRQKYWDMPCFKFVNLQDVEEDFFTFQTDRVVLQKLKNGFSKQG